MFLLFGPTYRIQWQSTEAQKADNSQSSEQADKRTQADNSKPAESTDELSPSEKKLIEENKKLQTQVADITVSQGTIICPTVAT